MDGVTHSSKSNEWETPPEIFNLLDDEFGFTLDPCATPENAKCDRFFTVVDDGLRQSWAGEVVFCNPPYGNEVSKWLKKAYLESRKPETVVVCLVAARPCTVYWHDYVWPVAAEIRFIRGRLNFLKNGIPEENNAGFGSAVLVYDRRQKEQDIRAWDLREDKQLTLAVGGR